MTPGATFARRVFLWAGVYGLMVLTPLYFLEGRIGQDYPPPLTHPEYYYSFVGVALAWQLVFLAISRDPVRLRPVMLAAIAEKLLSPISTFALFASSRAPVPSAVFATIDLALGTLFLVSWLRCRPAAGS